MQHLRWDAIWRAGLSASFFLLPTALVHQWLIDDGTIEGLGIGSMLFFCGYLFLGAVAGFGASKLVDEHVRPNGAAAAALAYGAVQTVGIVRRLVSGDELSSPVAYIFLALLMATCGMLGTMVEQSTKAMRR